MFCLSVIIQHRRSLGLSKVLVLSARGKIKFPSLMEETGPTQMKKTENASKKKKLSLNEHVKNHSHEGLWSHKNEKKKN